MNTPKSLYLIDAYALIYRAYYAFIKAPRYTSSGLNTSASFGFTTLLTDLLLKEKPDYIAVAFDPEGPTFRHLRYPAYKAQRPPAPEEIKSAVPYIKKIIRALGITIIEEKGYEADDVVGTLSKLAENQGFTVYMMTPDKDYAQLVSSHIMMLKPPHSGQESELWGVDEVLDHFSLSHVEQVIDLLGLMGDSADNIPGCAGIGPKGASQLLQKYDSIENIYAHIDELKGKQRENLENCKDIVLLSKELATICTAVPVKVEIEDLKRSAIDKTQLKALFDELQFSSLWRRFAETDVKETSPVWNLPISRETSPSSIASLLLKSSAFALAVKYPEGSLYAQYPSYLAFCTSEGMVNWIKMPEDASIPAFLQPLKPVFEKVLWISEDNKRDMIWLRRAGIEVTSPLFDVRIAHYLLKPDDSHSLIRISDDLLKNHWPEGKTEQQPLSLFDFADEQMIADEQIYRCEALFRLYKPLYEALVRNHLLSLYQELELPLITVLFKMEYEGVSIDREALKTYAADLKARIKALETTIFEEAETSFNINSPKQLGEILFDKLKLDNEAKKSKTGQYVTSEQVLSKLEDRHPIVSHILDYRGLNKLLNTYAEALPHYIDPATHKIHTVFNQAEAATGRLSSLNPNLQNIPIRTEEGQHIRRAFVSANSGCVIMSADYSQVELRLMAHLSGEPALIEAFLADEDIHTATAAKIYKVSTKEVTTEMRRRAKTANFGIIYGISAWGLAERLRIPRSEGKALIDGYFAMYPGVKRFIEESIAKARERGYVETIMGRKRTLPDINSKNAIVRGVAERNAVNAPIQGSAADIIKKAMISIENAIEARGLKSKMILQVHDELLFEVPLSEVDTMTRLVREGMGDAVKLSVPLTVGIGVGENWFEAH